MDNIKLTPWLLGAIKNGEAILFLGAGSTMGARRQDGKPPPSGLQLRDLLSETFLGGKRKEWPLDRVADYAKNLSTLGAVQSVIREQFEDLKPAPFHFLIPKFRWYAIVTTNYDLVLERTYERTSDRLQNLAPIIRDGDNFSQKLRDPNLVPYLKLHGSISVINDSSLPLILASEEYAKYEKNRTRLFGHFKDWGLEHPIIFCGYQIADPNIQHILFDLADLGISRPLYALVNPSLDELDETVWRGRRFETLKADFETFLKYLDQTIPFHARVISALRRTDQLSIARWFVTQIQPSDGLIEYLDGELEYVFNGIPTEGISPSAFYRGLTNSWEAFKQNLDIRRRVTDDILINWILDDSGLKSVRCFFSKDTLVAERTSL